MSGKLRQGQKAGAGTAREHLLAGGEKLALVHIQALWQEPDGSKCFAGRWYEVPQNTHTGRQVHPDADHYSCTDRWNDNGLFYILCSMLLLY